MSESKQRVVVGLSGGVDSAVSAFLLLEQGYEVEALFMKNWEEDDTNDYCASAEDLNDAQKVCDKLHIPLRTVNFSKEYWDNVFAHCLSEFRLGRTPNPDVLCNREIKFNTFFHYALELGADFIATGHYAQKAFSQNFKNDYELHKGFDANKDQSYFLYHINQTVLPKTLFPIGHLEKSAVRSIALQANLPNAHKKDSVGLCFIGKRKFKQFLEKYLPAKPGLIKTIDQKIVGKHDGLMFYTLGQRQGLKIGGLNDFEASPWYVVDKNLVDNVLVVAQTEENPLLFKNTLKTRDVHWISNATHFGTTPFRCTAKIRYRQKDEPCTVEPLEDNQYHIRFDNPQRAVTAGQSIVFYQDSVCLGGGIIQ